MTNRLYNCHAHVFTIDDVPESVFGPLGRPLVRKLVQRKGNSLVPRIVFRLACFFSSVDRLKAFADIADDPTQKRVFETMKAYYDDEAVPAAFVILTMDMEHMAPGTTPSQPYRIQIEELARLKRESDPDDQILPFFHADPRNPTLMTDLAHAIERLDFVGIKTYPAQGYYPDHPNLLPVWEYAVERSLPVMTHCGGTLVHYQGRITLPMRTWYGKPGIYFRGRLKARFSKHFTDPERWQPVLERPGLGELRLCLGHFGGLDAWKQYEKDRTGRVKTILALFDAYPNVYADISFALGEELEYLPMLKELLRAEGARERTLFGSDFYMLEAHTKGDRHYQEIKQFLSQEDFDQIARVNPSKWLH